MYPLAVFMVIFCIANISCRGRCISIEHDVGLRQSSRNDVIFVDDHLLWVLPTKSITGCAVACMKDDRCVSFTVTAGGSGTRRECRGHSAEPQGTGVTHPGARLYLLLTRSSTSGKSLSSASSPPSSTTMEVFNAVTSTKSPSATLHQRRTSHIHGAVISTIKSPSAIVQRRITSPVSPANVSISAAKETAPSPPASSSAVPEQCTTSSDCSPTAAAKHIECFENRCLCSPGFYYSLASGDCLYDCSADDLQRVLIEYPMWYLQGYNYESKTVDFNQCLDLCLNNIICRSVEYRYSLGTCSLSTYTPMDTPQAWARSTPLDRLHYFQRACT